MTPRPSAQPITSSTWDPEQGVNGGEVVACGTPAELQKNHRSLTGRYLARELEISLPARRRAGTGSFLQISGVRQRNLKDLTVQFPIGAMTCVTGVSGAGKSTLVMEVLNQEVSRRLQKERVRRSIPSISQVGKISTES
jgi:excinuclease ABC subunit A